MNDNYIMTKFLSYQNIVSWCESYAKKNGYKASIRLVDHKAHKTVDTTYVASLLYKMNIPSFRNSYNLRSFNNEKAVFYLTVKNTSIALICDFLHPVQNEIQGKYKVEPNGQLSFIF